MVKVQASGNSPIKNLRFLTTCLRLFKEELNYSNILCRVKSNENVTLGAFLFLYTGGSGKIHEKRPGEKREHEIQEEQTGTESPDTPGERWIARRVGDDPMAQRASESDMCQ